jgi:hypothetical protein
MGKGANMFVYNLDTNQQIVNGVTTSKCMYDNNKEGSNISLWNNVTIPSHSAIPENGWINPQYIEANGTDMCVLEQSSVSLGFANGGTLTIDLETAIPEARQTTTGNVMCSLSSNYSLDPFTGKVNIGVMILPDASEIPDQNLYIPKDTTRWMEELNANSNGKFFQQKFNKVSLPASHDSGMSCSTECTLLAGLPQTQTQTLDIAGQLNAGIRYFDLRPCVWDVKASNNSQDDFYFGHFTSVPVIGGMGCLGQNMKEALVQVASFLSSTTQEIVILKFSHFGDKDGNAFPCSLQELMIGAIKEVLADQMLAITNGEKINDETLQNVISSDRRVICVFDGLCPDLYNSENGVLIFGDLANSPNPDSNFDVHDNYSDSDNLCIMVADQINKYAAFNSTRNSKMFLFSYTLTQSTNDAITSAIGINSILDLANSANNYWWTVVTSLISDFSAQQIPNFVNLDNVDSKNAVSAAVYFNLLGMK